MLDGLRNSLDHVGMALLALLALLAGWSLGTAFAVGAIGFSACMY